MSRKWTIRIKDALLSISYIKEDTKNMTFAEFEDNRLVRQAVERNLEIIGEALNRVPEEIRVKYSEIPWRQIVGLRNFVIHEYFAVSHDIEWDVVTNEMDNLEKNLNLILKNEIDD